jgi:predicted  nucleic acid-binding Zn-ribbon protein
VIIEIKQPEAAPVEEVVDEELSKKIAEMEAQIEDMKKGKKAQEVKMAEAEAKFSAAIKELTDVVLQLIQTPSADATEKPKQTFNKVVPSKDARINNFLSKYAK